MVQKHLATHKIFYILEILLKQRLNLQEIKACLKNKFNSDGYPSNDMIYQYFNTLKNIGVEFKTLSKNELKRYIITEHPFHLILQDNEIMFLFQLREQLLETNNIIVIYLYDRLLDKIYLELQDKEFFTTCKHQFQRKLNNKYYSNLELLFVNCQKHSLLSIEYISPKNNNITFELIAEKLDFKDNVILFYGYSPLLDKTYCLRLDRIDSIKLSDNQNIQKYQLKYAIIDIYDTNYQPAKNEQVIKYFKNKIRIKEEYNTEFYLIQTLLKFKDKAKIIEPTDIQHQFVEILEKIKKDCEVNCAS